MSKSFKAAILMILLVVSVMYGLDVQNFRTRVNTGIEATTGVTAGVLTGAEEVDSASIEAGRYYYYDLLSDENKIIYLQLLEGLKNKDEEININMIDGDSFTKVSWSVLFDHPEIFWWEGSSNNWYRKDQVYQVLPDYNDTLSQAQLDQVQIEYIADKVVDRLPADATDYEKAQAAYNFVVDNTDYRQNSEDQNITSVFLDRESVCAGYAKSFQYLTQKMGLNCAYVAGQAFDNDEFTGYHAWNLLQVDGYWTLVDCTWDDPVDMEGKDASSSRYANLCITSQEFSRTRLAGDLFELPECVTHDYDYFYENGLYYDDYDLSDIMSACKAAVGEGNNSYSMKFSNQVAYESARNALRSGGDLSTIGSELATVAYTNRCYVVYSDAMLTLTVYWYVE